MKRILLLALPVFALTACQSTQSPEEVEATNLLKGSPEGAQFYAEDGMLKDGAWGPTLERRSVENDLFELKGGDEKNTYLMVVDKSEEGHWCTSQHSRAKEKKGIRETFVVSPGDFHVQMFASDGHKEVMSYCEDANREEYASSKYSYVWYKRENGKGYIRFENNHDVARTCTFYYPGEEENEDILDKNGNVLTYKIEPGKSTPWINDYKDVMKMTCVDAE